MPNKETTPPTSSDIASSINEVDLFLAFPDGVFHFVCSECTAVCCRGHGLSARSDELPVLITRYPAVESLANARAGNIVTLSTLTNTCVFLDTDNLCRIEKDLGRSAKPSLCVLFPFNAYKRIGSTIAVYPHFLCPFRLQIPARPGQVEGTHAVIDPAFRSSGLFEPLFVNANVPSLALHESLNAAEVVSRERQFLAAASAVLGKRTFFSVLRRSSSDAKALGSFVSRASNVLGLPRYVRSKDPDRIDNILLALSSPLRLHLLSLPSEGILRALALIEVITRRVATLPVEPIMPHAVFKFVEEHLSGIKLLARSEEPFVIPKEIELNPPPMGDPALIFSSFVFLREVKNTSNVLRSLEGAIPKTLSAYDRSALVQTMGRLLEPFHVRHAQQPPTKARKSRPARTR